VNRKQLAHLFARVYRRSPARAADEIDTLVYRMLKELRRPLRSKAASAAAPKQER